MPGNIKNVMAAIDYIESHLHEKLDLETVAGAVHYSKYHLHRMFTGYVLNENPTNLDGNIFITINKFYE